MGESSPAPSLAIYCALAHTPHQRKATTVMEVAMEGKVIALPVVDRRPIRVRPPRSLSYVRFPMGDILWGSPELRDGCRFKLYTLHVKPCGSYISDGRAHGIFQ